MPPEQKVVITGASRGRGESSAKGLCQIGYGAIVNARSIEKSAGANAPLRLLKATSLSSPPATASSPPP